MKTKILSILALLLTMTQGAWAQGSWNYDYTGAVQSFTAPYEGTYTLEAWGAQGGNWVKTDRSPGVGGKGGYASGTVTLAKNQTIYIYVGGQGATTENQQSGGAGGWNGGGTGGNSVSSEGNYVGAGGGGGASHVSLSNAQVIGTNVNTLSGTNYLIVAGGGGGAVTWTARAGAGGGTEGGAGATTGGTSLSPWYNSTLSTGRNGNNAVDYESFSAEGTGGGGGGYLGGNAGTVTSGTSNQDCGGCGGSSNYNSTYVTNFTTISDVREGAGKVTITFLSGEGTEDSPYLIASTTDWNNLVSAVNAGETYSGKYFKMTDNISVSERTSTSQINPFSGTFDGGGYTLNLSINETGTDATTAAPFGYVVGGTIKNVNVTGSVQTVKTRPASLVGFAGTNCTILNCKSSAAVSSSLNDPDDGDVDGGAFVACVDGNGTLTITGCTFTGSITYSGGVGYEGGGFVGWMRSGSSATLTDCLFAPTAVSLAKASPDFKMFAYNNTNTTLTLNNCYYNGTAACNDKITKQDGTMQMHTIAKSDYVSTLSVTKGDATATYDVSGITVYSGGIDFNDGSTTTFYGGSGQSVSLELTAATRTGYQFKQYAASQGTLSDETTNTPTLTMPAANSTANDVVVISAEYDPTYNATFADASDASNGWSISPTSGIVGSTVTVSYTGENKVKSVTVKANPSTLAGLKAAINDASDLTDLNTKVLGKYVTATGDIQSTSEGAVGIIAYISKTAVDNSFADSRIFVIATENASNSAAQAPSNAAETTYNSTSDLNGYAVTNAWQAAGYAASTAGWNYSASRPDGASHWFVPSYGQWMLGGWTDSNNRPCRLMRSTMEGSGLYYAVSTAINTEGNNTGYCVDGSWWGMGTIQRVQGIRVRAAFVY